MSYIRFKKLKFSYDNTNLVFKDVNFYLRENKTLSIIGTSGAGKTTLLKILNGDLNYEGQVIIDGLLVEEKNKKFLKSYIAVVFNEKIGEEISVKDFLKSTLKKLKLTTDEIKIQIAELNEYFALSKIVNKKINELSLNDQTLIKILSYAILKPTYLALDDLLINLNARTKIFLLNYLNSKNIFLINVTSEMEDVLFTDYTLCLYDGINAIDGKTLDVLKNEKILKRLGFSLPFMVDLSIQLKLYGLISKMYLNKEDMVKNLWK